MAKDRPTAAVVEALDEAEDEFLGRTIEEHKRLLRQSLRRLEKRIIDRIASLKTEKGRLVGPKVNLRNARRIHARLIVLFKETYDVAVRSNLKDLARIRREIKKGFGQLGLRFSWTDIDKDMVEQLRAASYSEFRQLGERAREQVARAMYSHVIAQSPFSDLVGVIRGALLDADGIGEGPIRTSAERTAFDVVMNYHNSVHVKKGRDAGLEHWLYTGTIQRQTKKTAGSREFCRRMLTQRDPPIYSEAEIAELDATTWAGKAGPLLQYRGGYNCRHHWRAVDPAWFEDQG